MANKKRNYTVTERTIEDYIPDVKNANLGSERGASMIEDSLSEDGAGRSLVADKEGRLVAGNKTQEAAVNAGITQVIEVETDGAAIIVHKRRDWDLSDHEGAARRYAYRDNRSGELSLTWNAEQLALDISAGVDLSRMFTEGELLALDVDLNGDVPEDPGPQIDRADELQEKWNVQPGDLYQVGNHRVLCGDSTDADDVARLMGGEKADAVVTDPPYNVSSHTSTLAKDAPTHHRSTHILANAEWDKNYKFEDGQGLLESVMAPDCSVYIFSSHHVIPSIWRWMATWAKLYNYCIWCKPNPAPTLSHRHWTWGTELIAYGTRGKHTFNYPVGHHLPNWWAVNVPHHDRMHPTQKPLEVIVKPIEYSTSKNAIIYDPFLGSGTTLVACEQLNRKGRGIEIHPPYVSVVLERLTGLGLTVEKADKAGLVPTGLG